MVSANSAARWTDEFDVGEGVDHHSYSAIHTFASMCQLKYRYQYIDRRPQECVADNLVLGTAIDLALKTIDQDLIHGKPPNVAFALQVFRTSLERAFSNPELPVASTKGETLESLYEKGKKLIEHYVSRLDQDDVLPVELPLYFKVPLIDEKGEALPRPLTGKLDRWVKSQDGGIGIDDWKTAAARWPADKIAKDDQSTAYLLGGEQILGEVPKFFRYVLLLKTKDPAVEPYFAHRTQTDRRRFLRKVTEVDKALKSGAFLPNDESFTCSTCSFRNACRTWQD
ncbi:MAG TPA: PD-(D/E)XK nuclease family protein [Planctomycetota bacterium]|nr:PD-(D/E)XK nuclease family protein [Planctomycetota bacterium]